MSTVRCGSVKRTLMRRQKFDVVDANLNQIRSEARYGNPTRTNTMLVSSYLVTKGNPTKTRNGIKAR